MIIDEILDRKDFDNYNAKEFYNYCSHYEELSFEITRAMDYGDNKDVQKALCKYIVDNNYNIEICKYVNSKNWLGEDE